MDRTTRLREEEPSKLLLSLSIPAIIGMLVNSMYNVVDRIFVGHGVGAEAIAAITVSFPVMIIGMAFGMLVGIGSTALISIRMGEKREEEAEKIFGNAITLTILISIILTILGLIFIDPMLTFFGAKAEVFVMAKKFLTITLIGMLPQTFTMAMNSIIRGEGNAKFAMSTMILGAVLNTILNPIFIFVFKWGIIGSALATLISMSIGSIWVLSYFLSDKSHLKIHKKNMALTKSIVISIFAIGSSPFAVQIGSSLVITIFNMQLLKYGTEKDVAILGIAFAIVMLFIMPVLGISQGAQPIIGYNFGAKNFARVRKTLYYAIIYSTIISLIGFALSMLFAKELVSAFVKDAEVISSGETALRIFMLMMPVVGMQIIGANYFLYIGKPKHSILLTASRQIFLLIPFLFIFPMFLKLNGIWIAGPASDFLSFLFTSVFLYNELKKEKKAMANLEIKELEKNEQ